MIKRIATAVMALPIAFVFIWVTLAVLTFFLGTAIYAGADLMPVDVAGLYKTPVALAQAAQASWKTFVVQYLPDSQGFWKVVSDDAHRFWVVNKSAMVVWCSVAAAIGAIIFSLSKVSPGMGRAMLIFRRLISAPLVLGVVFLILAVPVVYLTGIISHQWVISSTWSRVEKSLGTDDESIIKPMSTKPVADALLNFETHSGLVVRLCAAGVALLLALFLTEKLIFAGWLPWCYKDIRVPEYDARKEPKMKKPSLAKKK